MKKSLNFRIFFVLCILFSVVSCNKPHDFLPEPTSDRNNSLRVATEVDKLYDSKSNLKREFGKALVKSMKESKALRDLIRTKALEMFNKDYDVLYGMIADEKLENNVTVNDMMMRNMTDRNVIKNLESISPTLTILVPELPENSFNAEKWDTSTEIPRVAIRLTTSNDVPVIDLDGSERVIEWKYTPAFPVLVIKDNERVVAERDKEFNKKDTRSFQNKKGEKYRFTFDDFDKQRDRNKRFVGSSQLDSKLVTAYNNYQNADGWQRDLIYYDISPNQDRGAFNYDFQEKIRSFSLVGDPIAAYNKIADQTDDPHINGTVQGSGSHWTGGSFEFKVTALINARNGVGTEIPTGFGASPDQLFYLTYEKIVNDPWCSCWDLYVLTNIALKPMTINTVGLINWDLNNYATSIKISIEEVDQVATTQVGESTSVKFASNFGIDGGVLKKIGLKFGGSLETTQIQTYQRTVTDGNDILGSVIVNFADKVITGNINNLYITREYTTGYYSISVEPTRVQ